MWRGAWRFSAPRSHCSSAVPSTAVTDSPWPSPQASPPSPASRSAPLSPRPTTHTDRSGDRSRGRVTAGLRERVLHRPGRHHTCQSLACQRARGRRRGSVHPADGRGHHHFIAAATAGRSVHRVPHRDPHPAHPRRASPPESPPRSRRDLHAAEGHDLAGETASPPRAEHRGGAEGRHRLPGLLLHRRKHHGRARLHDRPADRQRLGHRDRRRCSPRPPGTSGVILTAVVATLVLLLRARTYANGSQAVALLTTGMVSAAGILLGWMCATTAKVRLLWVFGTRSWSRRARSCWASSSRTSVSRRRCGAPSRFSKRLYRSGPAVGARGDGLVLHAAPPEPQVRQQMRARRPLVRRLGIGGRTGVVLLPAGWGAVAVALVPPASASRTPVPLARGPFRRRWT